MTAGINPTLRCPCDDSNREPALTYHARPEGETVFAIGAGAYQRAYDRCRVCGHFFGRHALDLGALYARDYVDATYGGAEGMRRRFESVRALPPERSDNVARVARIHAFWQAHPGPSPASQRLLDIGAGIGVFPAAMKQLGWTVAAIEPDERTVRHLEEVAGVATWQDDLFQLRPERTGLFDVVTLNKVLEHFEDPVAMLAQAARFLSPSGFVHVEVPDVAALCDGSGREEFFIEHHHVFSPCSLAATIERSGLDLRRLDRLREPSGKYTLFAFARLPANPVAIRVQDRA